MTTLYICTCHVYICVVCGKGFGQSSNLFAIRECISVKNLVYICNVCGKGLAREVTYRPTPKHIMLTNQINVKCVIKDSA